MPHLKGLITVMQGQGEIDINQSIFNNATDVRLY
jgi:hypothetical protein